MNFLKTFKQNHMAYSFAIWHVAFSMDIYLKYSNYHYGAKRYSVRDVVSLPRSLRIFKSLDVYKKK